MKEEVTCVVLCDGVEQHRFEETRAVYLNAKLGRHFVTMKRHLPSNSKNEYEYEVYTQSIQASLPGQL